MIEPQIEMKDGLEPLCRGCEDLEYFQAGAGKENEELVQTILEDLVGSSFLPPVDDKNNYTASSILNPQSAIDRPFDSPQLNYSLR